jgi:large subunit ribosomal protein L5
MFINNTIFSDHYQQVLSEDLLLKQNIFCLSQLLKIEKIIVTQCSPLSQKNIQFLIPPLTAQELISGQKAKITQTIKAVANFQTRKNEPIGSLSTLQKEKAYSFLEKLVYLYLPRQQNNLKKKIYANVHHFGIDDCLLFPECESFYDLFHTEYVQGFNINIHTKNKKKQREGNRLLLSGFLLNTL